MTGPISATAARPSTGATNNGAPRQRIVATDIARPALDDPRDRAEDEATLQGASIVGRQLIARYLVDAKSEVRTFALDGRRTGTIAPARHRQRRRLSAATSRAARPSTASPASTAPARSTATTARPAQSSVFAEPRARLRSRRDYEVRQVFYTLEGRHAGADVPGPPPRPRPARGRSRPCSTAMAASTRPSCRASSRNWMTWVDMGGVLAVANLRGGGEYGQAWHDAGRPRQQAERVRRFHRRGRISDRARGSRAASSSPIEGRSNGGLLVGAVAQPAAGPVRRGAARPSA